MGKKDNVDIDKMEMKIINEKRLDRLERSPYLRSRDLKQVKVFSSDEGHIKVALYLGRPFYPRDPQGKVYARTQQSIWMWDSIETIRRTPAKSTRIIEFFDEEERAQQVFNSFLIAEDVYEAIKYFKV